MISALASDPLLRLFVRLPRNYRRHLVPTKRPPHTLATIFLVARQLSGTFAPTDANRVHHRFDGLAFMALPSRDFNASSSEKCIRFADTILCLRRAYSIRFIERITPKLSETRHRFLTGAGGY